MISGRVCDADSMPPNGAHVFCYLSCGNPPHDQASSTITLLQLRLLCRWETPPMGSLQLLRTVPSLLAQNLQAPRCRHMQSTMDTERLLLFFVLFNASFPPESFLPSANQKYTAKKCTLSSQFSMHGQFFPSLPPSIYPPSCCTPLFT